VIVALIVAVAAFSYSETYRLQIKDYTYAGSDVPAAFDGTRIVLLTDIHRSFYFTQQRLVDIIDRVNALEPDLVVLGGDYVNGTRDYEAPVFAALTKLKAPLGVYAVMGNHDYDHTEDGGTDPSATLSAAEAAGVHLLYNRGAWIEKSGQRFLLAGVTDFSEDTPLAALAIYGSTPDDFVVLASHQPDYAEYLLPGDADLVLSGHTHGGQVTFFGLWTPLSATDFGHETGVTKTQNGDATVVVSNGVGTIFPPVRFFARPQLVVVTLQHAE
jgi:uncharacterized protein